MTTPSLSAAELLVRALESAQQYVAGIRADQWADPTPCTEWDVRELVGHLVNGNLWAGELFNGKTMAEVSDRFDGDVLGDDPAGAFTSSVAIAKEVVLAPGAMEAICHLSFGDYPGSEYAEQLFLDMLVHGWDLATATGQDARLAQDLVAACYPVAQKIVAVASGDGVFGEDLPVTSDADLQTRLLATLGRRVSA